jgi:hypothetical protein
MMPVKLLLGVKRAWFSTIEAIWAAADLDLYAGSFRLRLLSVHDHVLNLAVESWQHLLFVADEQLEKGPATIGIANRDYCRLKEVLKTGAEGVYAAGQISLNKNDPATMINRGREKLISFAPVFSSPPADSKVLMALKFYLDRLKNIVLHTPAAVLLDRAGGEEYFRNAIKKNFPGLINALLDQKRQDLIKYCRNISGMGHGLTPTGDDLIHGAFATYSALTTGRKIKRAFKLSQLEMPVETGLFGQHMLEMGKRGLTPAAVCSYLEAVDQGHCAEQQLQRLLRIGSSTGSDLAIAVTCTLKYFTENDLFI